MVACLDFERLVSESECGHVVVKNTFLELFDKAPAVEDARPIRRVLSDPALYHCSAETEIDEFEITGLSDAETETDTMCLQQQPSGRSSDDAASTNGSLHEESTGTPPAAAEMLNSLVATNTRLELENRRLKESIMAVTPDCWQGAVGQQMVLQAPSSELSQAVWVYWPVAAVAADSAHLLAEAPSEAAALATAPRRGTRGRGRGRRGGASRSSADAADGALPKAETPESTPAPAQCPPCGGRGATTVMLRNIPNNYSRDMLLDLLSREGFSEVVDFVYLPIDFNSKASLGYAFVNVVNESVVSAFWSHFDGFRSWSIPTKKVCSVCWAGPHQGLEAHIERYRDSPVMHESIPDEFKPVILKDGVRVAFPEPERLPHAPRVRQRDARRQRQHRTPATLRQ